MPPESARMVVARALIATPHLLWYSILACKTHYETLSLQRTASEAEIKSAYRKVCR